MEQRCTQDISTLNNYSMCFPGPYGSIDGRGGEERERERR